MSKTVNTVLTVYSRNAFKRFLLPSIKNSDYKIFLSRILFGISRDITLNLEIEDDHWTFVESDDYDVRTAEDNKCAYGIFFSELYDKGNTILRLITDDSNELSIVLNITDVYFAEYASYDISHLRGQLTIGRNPNSIICYDRDNTKVVSDSHAVIYKDGEDCFIRDDSSNGSFVNNKRVGKTVTVKLEYGDCIDIFGLRIIYLGDYLKINVTESGAIISGKGLVECSVDVPKVDITKKRVTENIFHRSPRQIPKIENGIVKIDDPPEPKEEVRQRGLLSAIGGALSMALPMLLGCAFMIFASRISGFSRGVFMYVGLVTASTSAVIGTIRSVTSIRNATKEYKQYEALRNERYGEYLRDQERIIKDKYNRNRIAMLERYPESAICATYNIQNTKLWNRNAGQEDYLAVRLGLGDVPFQVDIDAPDKKFSMTDNNLLEISWNISNTYRYLHNVPVCLDLLKNKLTGIISNGNVVADILAQIAVNNSYTDVKIAFIYNAEKSDHGYDWECVRWLPHVWNEGKSFRYMASDREEASDVFYELNKIIQQRLSDNTRDKEIKKPYYIVFVLAPEFLEGEMVSKYILSPDENLGFSTLYVTESYDLLSNRCELIIEESREFNGIYHISDSTEDRCPIAFDTIDNSALEKLTHTLTNIAVNEVETGGDLPNSVTFMEMYGVRNPSELDVLTRWKKNKTYESMKAMIGQKANGIPCYLDIHEKFHGPHGLVAGTTGSGKSETLQTYILSLAVNYSPDDIGFFVIDYKGGGMANLFVNLPHMIGQISNLSGNQVNRALVSIQSEKDRREKIFSECGVKDIRDYTKLYRSGEVSVALPHLIIVIDEFAEMKTEEPEFIQEIISVSRVGRSLGIHLIMATQKPAGSVSDDIWSNSRFKLCLRVQSRQDSMDMLHKADAAYLAQSGRCYLQVGNDELYELFQSGYSGAQYYEDDDICVAVADMIGMTGVPVLEGNHLRMMKQKARKEEKRADLTELEAIVDYLRVLAKESGFNNNHSLFLPLLKERVFSSELEGEEYSWSSRLAFVSGRWCDSRIEVRPYVGIGIYDDPENQRQDIYVIDFMDAGDVLITGAPSTGKSTLMQTIIYNLIHAYTPDEVNIYALELNSQKLSLFADAPHVGGIITGDDLDGVDKFFTMMEEIIHERKRALKDLSYEQLVANKGLRELPAIFVFIDNITALITKTNEKYNQAIINLIKDGINNGIYTIASSVGIGGGEVSNNMAQNFKTVICLELNNSFDYGSYMRVARLKIRPEAGIKGRAIAYINGRILEYQTAIAINAENDIDTGNRIRQEAKLMSESWDGKAVRRIPSLPENPDTDVFAGEEETCKLLMSDRILPIGYDVKDARVYGVDLSGIYSYIISGGRKKGKTNTLKVVMNMASRKGGKIVFIDFDKRLKSYAESVEAEYIDEVSALAAFMTVFLKNDVIKRNQRKKELIEQGYEEADIYSSMLEFERVYICIDNLDVFVERIGNYHDDIADNLVANIEMLLDKGYLHNIFWFVTVNKEETGYIASSNIYKLLMREKKGLHLGGMVHQSAVPGMSFDNHDRKKVDIAYPVGIGMIPDGNESNTVDVLIPLAKGGSVTGTARVGVEV